MIVSHIDMIKLSNSEKKQNGMRIKSDFVIHDFGMEFLGCIETIQKKQNRARTKPDFLIHDYGMEFLGYIRTIQKKTKWNANKL